jgi:hypothetical protein
MRSSFFTAAARNFLKGCFIRYPRALIPSQNYGFEILGTHDRPGAASAVASPVVDDICKSNHFFSGRPD